VEEVALPNCAITEFREQIVGEIADSAQQEYDGCHDPKGAVEVGVGFYQFDELFVEGRDEGVL
jgi:hypothetical protein